MVIEVKYDKAERIYKAIYTNAEWEKVQQIVKKAMLTGKDFTLVVKKPKLIQKSLFQTKPKGNDILIKTTRVHKHLPSQRFISVENLKSIPELNKAFGAELIGRYILHAPCAYTDANGDIIVRDSVSGYDYLQRDRVYTDGRMADRIKTIKEACRRLTEMRRKEEKQVITRI